jgi:hypothetical protein
LIQERQKNKQELVKKERVHKSDMTSLEATHPSKRNTSSSTSNHNIEYENNNDMSVLVNSNDW